MNAKGTLLLTSIEGSGFQVWDLNEPTAMPKEFEIADQRLVFTRFAPDEQHVLVGLSSRTSGFGGGRVRGGTDEIRYLSLDDGEKVWSVETNVGAGSFDFSPDGGSLAVIETEEAGQPCLTIRSAATGRQRQAMLLPRAAWRGMSTSGIGTVVANMTGRMQLRYRRDGRSLLLATGSGLRQLDFPQSALLTTVASESETITDFGIIGDGDAIYVFGQDRQQVFDLTTGGLRTTTYSGHRGLVSQDGAAMSVVKTITEQSGPRSAPQDLQVANLATGAIDEEFQLFRSNNGRGRGELTGLSHDSAHFATAVAEAADSVDEEDAGGSPGRQTVLIRDSLTGDVLAEGHLSAFSQWCVSPQSAWLAELNGLGQFVDLENLQTDDSWSLTMARAANVLTGRGGIAFSRDERWLVVASGAQLNIFDLHDPEFERTLVETDSIILDLALLPDNHTMLTLENSGVLRLSDIDTGHSFSMELDCARAPREFSVSTDGSRLATLHPGANGSQIRVWRMPQPIEGTAEQIETMVAQQTGITLDGRGVRELSPEEMNSNVVPRADTDAVARWYQSRATDAIDDANWHAALWHLERWATEEPDDPTPYAWSAFCHLQQGDIAAAVDALERTRERTRGREASFASLVPLLLKSTLVNKVPNEQVLEHLQHQLDLDPNSTESLLRRSWIEANLRRWPDAIRDREAVVQLRPDDHDIQLDLVAYYLAAGEYDDALHRHVAWMFDHSESTDTPAERATVALAGLIVPVDDDLVQRAAELADAARQRFRRDGNAPTGLIDRLFNNADSDDDGKVSPDEQQDLPPFFVAQLALPEGSEKSLTRDDIAALLRPLTEGAFGTRPRTRKMDVLLAKGIADYRRGDREGARENLNEARKSTAASEAAQETRPQVALIQLFLAMTANAENPQAAGEHMESARAILDAHVDDPSTYDANLEWWIFAREVLKEAEETLEKG
jgi:tetratricopeptide (TPR) repeat protein